MWEHILKFWGMFAYFLDFKDMNHPFQLSVKNAMRVFSGVNRDRLPFFPSV